jgi:error-prone DNA polymerase
MHSRVIRCRKARLWTASCENGVAEGVARRYGPKRDSGLLDRAKKQVEHELTLIARLGFEGYFLIVWDIVQFCERNGILIQGRGSACHGSSPLEASA